MKILHPSDISGKLLALIEDSREKFVIVSPYIRITKWYKLKNSLEALMKRGVVLEIYLRYEKKNAEDYAALTKLGMQFTFVPYLHSKFYLNENRGIVSSMNLLFSSEVNSLEIGYETESREDYNDLAAYYLQHIRPFKYKAGLRQGEWENSSFDLLIQLGNRLREMDKELWLKHNGIELSVKYKQREFKISQANKSNYRLNILCTMRGKLPDEKSISKLEDLAGMTIELEPQNSRNNVVRGILGVVAGVEETGLKEDEVVGLAAKVMKFMEAFDDN